MTSEELIKQMRNWWEYDHAHLISKAIDRIEELEAKLKTSEEIGRAFEEDAVQLQAKLAKALAVLRLFKYFDDMPLSAKRPDVFERKVRNPVLATLAEIEEETK